MTRWPNRLVPVVAAVCLVAAGAATTATARGSTAASAGPSRLAMQASASRESLDELYAEGEMIFGSSCVACHDSAGGDGQAPALSGHPSMGAADHIVRQILRGNVEKGMPAFAGALDDRQIAAVATYVRNAWDNAFGVVSQADARRVRDEQAP